MTVSRCLPSPLVGEGARRADEGEAAHSESVAAPSSVSAAPIHLLPRGEKGEAGNAPSLIAFFDRDAAIIAPELLGATLTYAGVGGVIVEVEAYHPSDPASHSFNGPTPRNLSMFGPVAHVYVYRSYGIHWCVNFVCHGASAILIRAIEPTLGLGIMRERRGLEDVRALCSGPGKLCAAMGITKADDGKSLCAPPFALELNPHDRPVHVGKRIGITKAVDVPWRFGIKGSRFLSRKFGAGE
jgi:DNA-3-methyladenine glycosylase